MALGDGAGVEEPHRERCGERQEVLSIQLVTDQGVCVRKLPV